MGTVVTWQQGIEENGHLKAFLPHYQMFLGLCVDDKWSSPHYQMFLRLCVDDKWSSSGATNVGGYVENKVLKNLIILSVMLMFIAIKLWSMPNVYNLEMYWALYCNIWTVFNMAMDVWI